MVKRTPSTGLVANFLKGLKMETNVDPNEIVNDLLEQIKQLTAANTVLRVNLNTTQRALSELQEQAVLAEQETMKESEKTAKP